MKKLILFVLAVLMLIYLSNKYEDNYYIIPKESIRIRIIPNSNSVKDQYLKNQVKTNLEKRLYNDLKDSNNIETSRIIINNNIDKYKELIKSVLAAENSHQIYNINYGYHYFPEKVYKGVKYEEGQYESLLVTLGNGQGDNWWCVLFPPICSIESDSSDKEDIEYSFYVKEMFKKYFK